jgi:hypothetical protein
MKTGKTVEQIVRLQPLARSNISEIVGERLMWMHPINVVPLLDIPADKIIM